MVGEQNNRCVPVHNLPNNPRISRLIDLFHDEFSQKPKFVVTVPGRVNIIGEHIDYCGYPVLPMAIEQNILIAVADTEESTLKIRNADKKYQAINYDFETFEGIEIKHDANGKPYWFNYVLCGVKGALENLNNKFKCGLIMYVDGNIPPASGLSSSSALVSAACLSFLWAQDTVIDKSDISSLCARSERYIGTQGGGMDQAIAFLAEKYCAQYITWKPLKATAIGIPEEVVFVVAHSLAEANKAATNDFNRRVMECRLAAKILATITNTSSDNKIVTLSQVQNNLGISLNEMIKLVKKHLTKDVYTKDEICQMLNVTTEVLDTSYLSENTKHLTEFKLRQRALHVYEEAVRVETFRKLCSEPKIANGNGIKNGTNGINENGVAANIISSLGELMLASHDSLKNLYECSHENLDILVDISKKKHVYARLTGAGWGGCIVALCSKSTAEDYIEYLKENYYATRLNLDKVNVNDYVFVTSPNHGAIIFNL